MYRRSTSAPLLLIMLRQIQSFTRRCRSLAAPDRACDDPERRSSVRHAASSGNAHILKTDLNVPIANCQAPMHLIPECCAPLCPLKRGRDEDDQ